MTCLTMKVHSALATQATIITRTMGQVPQMANFSNQWIVRPLHCSQILQLRKAPQSRNNFFGVSLAYLPWPSQFLRAVIRKRTHPDMFGKDKDHRQTIFHRLSVAYVFLTWTALGGALYYFYNKEPEKNNSSDSESPGLPNQEEIDQGG